MPTVTPLVIALTGPLGSGKTTLAEAVLRTSHAAGLPAHRLSFGDGVKDVARYLGWDGVKNAKGRRLLQLLGTECGRECVGPDVWVDRWQQTFDRLLARETELARSRYVVLVADDVRFDNEAEAVLERDGLIFRVAAEGLEAGRVMGIDGHASERPISSRYVARDVLNSPARPVEDAALEMLLTATERRGMHGLFVRPEAP